MGVIRLFLLLDDMRKIYVHNLNNTDMPPLLVDYCASFFCQLRGLTFRRKLSSNEGILLVQGRDSRLDSAIHMFGVWIDLAAIWINGAMQVVDVRLVRRWRPWYFPKEAARFILESDPQRLHDFHIGDKVEFEEADLG
jgi:uncharacterized membrane protein (UPF0127 family)